MSIGNSTLISVLPWRALLAGQRQLDLGLALPGLGDDFPAQRGLRAVAGRKTSSVFGDADAIEARRQACQSRTLNLERAGGPILVGGRRRCFQPRSHASFRLKLAWGRGAGLAVERDHTGNGDLAEPSIALGAFLDFARREGLVAVRVNDCQGVLEGRAGIQLVTFDQAVLVLVELRQRRL